MDPSIVPTSLRQKTEVAFLKVITAAGGATIVALNKLLSQEGTQTKRALPSVDAFCMGGPEFPVYTGNYRYRTVITFRTSADPSEAVPDPSAAHTANVKAGVDALHQDDLADRLSAQVDNFHCFAFTDLGEVASKPEERALVSSFAFETLVCETDCS
jgi:hypothetical protein